MSDRHDAGERLRQSIERATPRLRAISDEASARRPAPGTWSPKEIIGHLIDSASNNHGRFVRAQRKDDLVFDGYGQDDWVAVQQYQAASWRDLVELWRAFNLHLARVMTLVPEGLRDREHTRHNLHEIAWRSIPPDQPATLEYFMQDYVDHLEHHLTQILKTP
jgi:hypothetical protein